MTVIYVDADACPVKDEVIRVAERHGLMVHLERFRAILGHLTAHQDPVAALRILDDVPHRPANRAYPRGLGERSNGSE